MYSPKCDLLFFGIQGTTHNWTFEQEVCLPTFGPLYFLARLYDKRLSKITTRFTNFEETA